MFDPCLPFDEPPYRLSGIVFGTALNHPGSLAALAGAVHEAPYKAPPRAPVLYVKPRNTLAAPGTVVAVPSSCPALEVGAALGLVIGRTACRVAEAQALGHLSGYTLVADLSVPHDSFYRPSVRFKALDDSCLIGPRVVSRRSVADPGAVRIRVTLDGAEVHATSTEGMLRSAARLLADVSEFMTLRPGDILMLGIAAGAPRARPGQAFAVEADGLGRLEGRLAAGSTSP